MLLIAIALISVLHPCNYFPFLGVNTKERKVFDQQSGMQMRPMPYQPGGYQQGPPPQY